MRKAVATFVALAIAAVAALPAAAAEKEKDVKQDSRYFEMRT
jgi:hypothetical protein